MYFPNTTACIGSLLMATASASTPASFEVPGSAPGTAAAPQADTTTIYETSTHYVTSAMTVTSGVSMATSVSNSTTSATKTGYAPPPAEYPMVTPEVSLYVSANQTLVPVTLWEGSTTRVIFPQNSTALEIPTGYPANGTSTVVVTATTSSSKTVATTTKDKTSASTSASASVSEVPVNDAAGKTARSAVLGMGVVAGLMALL